MKLQFECPACGGMIDYPNINRIIEEYDPSDTDKYYYKDVVEDELTVVCDWCKKRVEVPLDPPAVTPRNDPLKQFDAMEAPGEMSVAYDQWPTTKPGKIALGALLLMYIIPIIFFCNSCAY